jgi:tetratricopeptide (TPR) repeat protein
MNRWCSDVSFVAVAVGVSLLQLALPGYSLTSIPCACPRPFHIAAQPQSQLLQSSVLRMVSSTETEQDRSDALGNIKALEAHKNKKRKFRNTYKRKREKPITEMEADALKEKRQAEYDEVVSGNPASIWAFENLFPEPVWDETSIQRDLFQVTERERKIALEPGTKGKKIASKAPPKLRSSIAGTSIMKIWREPKLSAPQGRLHNGLIAVPEILSNGNNGDPVVNLTLSLPTTDSWKARTGPNDQRIDVDMTQRVEGAVYGIRATGGGDFMYDTSLMGEVAVQFRDGVRLGNALRVNADRLNYLAKKEMAKNRLEEAQDLYEQALAIDPRDGRSYLGLSRIAEKRRDFKLARQFLRSGISNSVSVSHNGKPDFGGNPFLLQAFGCMEEKAGHLSEAESLYISAVRSRPSHTAAWVALAQLRTRKLRQNAAAGRICFQTAERELKRAGLPPSAHVYTAWAALEYKKASDIRRARELFQMALEIDPKCSAALLQMGVMEADKENWDTAVKCFDKVLKFDKRNSRVLQAYAIMESKRPDGSSRKAIDLFERALEAKPRDAVVLQAYALFVVKLGDIDAARSL